MNIRTTIVAVAASFAAFSAVQANAAAVNCDTVLPDVTDFVTPSSACQFSNAISNDAPAPDAVNGENFFGYNDWIFDAKDDDLDGVNEGPNAFGLVLTGGQEEGEWDLTSLSSLDGLEIMLVFKGATIADPAALVAYLITDVAGDYLTPFFGPSGKPQEISHVSVYYRETQVIPLPAAAWLMLAGVAGLGFASRKKLA